MFIHGDTGKRLYRIWRSMKNRCYNQSHKYYKHYGGKGITICDEWKNDYVKFKEWAMQNGYDDTMSIDRINNNKGYEPSNCRFIYYRDQPKNRDCNHRVVVDGVEMNVSDVSRKYGIPISTVCYRANRGRNILTAERKRSVEYQGRKQSLAKWSKELGIELHTIYERLERGWSVEESLKTPVLPRKRRKYGMFYIEDDGQVAFIRRKEMTRKLELMYEMFGKSEGKCKECKHYTSYKYHDKRYRKCKVYGVTCSEATDWKASGDACGLFNKDTEYENIVRMVTVGKTKEDIQIDGQMSFTDYEGVPFQFDNMTGSMNL